MLVARAIVQKLGRTLMNVKEYKRKMFETTESEVEICVEIAIEEEENGKKFNKWKSFLTLTIAVLDWR